MITIPSSSFKAFERGIKVNGITVMSIVHGLGSLNKLAEVFFLQVGLPSPKKIVIDLGWYSQQKWLNVLKLVEEIIGENILYKIGRKIPKNLFFSSEDDTIEEALKSINIAYHMNHRNERGEILYDPTRPSDRIMLEGIGHYWFKNSPVKNQIIMVCKNPYPCALDRGVITAIAKNFEPTAVVTHDDTCPCRKHGADSCTYIVHLYSETEVERQQLVKLRNTYLDALNHGLRTPLTQLLMGIEFFYMKYNHKLPPNDLEVLELLYRSVLRLNQFIDQNFGNDQSLEDDPFQFINTSKGKASENGFAMQLRTNKNLL